MSAEIDKNQVATPQEGAAKVKIGFIGTGNMGKHMANNLIKAGYELTVHDKQKEATEELVLQGARWADTPKAVAEASKVVITSLPGPREVEDVVLGANGVLAGAHEGDFYIDMSTSTPSSIRKIASVAIKKNIRVLDAPVSGGARGARKATLAIMIGGSQSAFDFCEPIFNCLGQRIVLMGDVGTGYATKLVNNMMAASNSMAAMESMIIGAKAGVDIQKLLEVVDAGTGSSFMLRNLFPFVIFKGKFEPPNFTMALAAKDLRLSVDYAEELGVPVKVIRTVSDAIAEAAQQGMAEMDNSTYVTILEKAAGVELRV